MLLSLEGLGEHILQVCGRLNIVEALQPAAEETLGVAGHARQPGRLKQVGLLHGAGHDIDMLAANSIDQAALVGLEAGDLCLLLGGFSGLGGAYSRVLWASARARRKTLAS